LTRELRYEYLEMNLSDPGQYRRDRVDGPIFFLGLSNVIPLSSVAKEPI
jgi:hypothetical protein